MNFLIWNRNNNSYLDDKGVHVRYVSETRPVIEKTSLVLCHTGTVNATLLPVRVKNLLSSNTPDRIDELLQNFKMIAAKGKLISIDKFFNLKCFQWKDFRIRC